MLSKQYLRRYGNLNFQFPQPKPIPFNNYIVPINNSSRDIVDDRVKYIIVIQEVENLNDIKQIFENLNIDILDKTYVEKYLIYSILATKGMISIIKKYDWFVNASRGQSQ